MTPKGRGGRTPQSKNGVEHKPGRSSMDPRIRARRAGVQRDAGRRRLRALAWSTSIVAAAVGAWLIATSPIMDVDQIEVSGASRVTASEVARRSGVENGDALLFLDRDAVKRRVEDIPWVASARVERSFFGTVRIEIRERSPLAAVVRPDGSGYALVDTGGVVLDSRRQRPLDVPEIVGFPQLPRSGTWSAGSDALRVLDALTREVRARILTVTNPSGEILLRLREGTEIRFGPPQDIEAKVAAALAVLERSGERLPGYLDVRVPTAPVTGELPPPVAANEDSVNGDTAIQLDNG